MKNSSKTVKPYWCAVRVEGNRERKAQYFVEIEHHRQTYCPRFLDLRRSNSVRPVYPGYIFVFLHDLQFAFLKRTSCVVGPVIMGAMPNVIPERIIMNMKLREDERGLLPLIESKFKRGQTVTVTSGPLMGSSGCYDGYVRADHHRIILDLLGQSVRAELPTSMLDVAA